MSLRIAASGRLEPKPDRSLPGPGPQAPAEASFRPCIDGVS